MQAASFINARLLWYHLQGCISATRRSPSTLFIPIHRDSLQVTVLERIIVCASRNKKKNYGSAPWLLTKWHFSDIHSCFSLPEMELDSPAASLSSEEILHKWTRWTVSRLNYCTRSQLCFKYSRFRWAILSVSKCVNSHFSLSED